MNYLRLLWELYTQKRNTAKTREQIKELQEKRLRKMLRFAYQNSAFYRQSFEAEGISEENIDTLPLSSFPSIDKATLLAHFDDVVTVKDITQEQLRAFDEQAHKDREPYRGKYHIVHSSGSTGKPGYFLYDEKAWNSMLVGLIRAALWNMSMPQILRLLKKGPRIVYIAATDGRYGGAMAVGDGIDGVRASQLHLDIKTPLSEWITQIDAFKPNMIIGYPSAIKILGELVEDGKLSTDVFRVISCGEPLGVGLREYLERVFKAEVINFYGASESLALGVETNPDEGMLLFDDMNVIEVQDGAMYLTSLYNFAQPLIRYRLSDDLTLKEPEENSVYPFTKAMGLVGRSEDILWFEDGSGNREFLHPLAIEGFCVDGLIDYQFRKTGTSSFELYIEVSMQEERITNELSEQLDRILTEKKLGFVTYSIQYTEAITPNPETGKKSLIVIDTEEKATA